MATQLLRGSSIAFLSYVYFIHGLYNTDFYTYNTVQNALAEVGRKIGT